jgi:hypothetical protein
MFICAEKPFARPHDYCCEQALALDIIDSTAGTTLFGSHIVEASNVPAGGMP